MTQMWESMILRLLFYLGNRHGRIDRSRSKIRLLLKRLLSRKLLLNYRCARKLLLQELLLEKSQLLLLLNLE